MLEGKPSGTAYRVALRRATHQIVDKPLVFRDPLALRILGLNAEGKSLRGEDAKSRAVDDMSAETDLRAPARPTSVALRAFLVARSRFAEDTLASAVQETGATQYVLLGAGLDTFAYRNPYGEVCVFEVDHPQTQAWKSDLLQRTGIARPENVAYVAVDFQTDSLREKLLAAGFDFDKPAVFAWLGVVPYLTDEGFSATMDVLSTCAAGSTLILDYGLPREALPFLEQLAFDSLAARVAAVGEPFQLFFMPDEIHKRMAAWGWRVLEDLDRDATNARYFADREDHLRCLSSAAHLLSIRLA